MENWSNEIWVAIGIAFIVGLFIGYIIVRLTKGSVKHQAKTEAELKTVKTQLDTQKAQIEKHFAESAELFKTLITIIKNFIATTQPLPITYWAKKIKKVYLPNS